MTKLTMSDIIGDDDITFAARTFTAAFHHPLLWERMTDEARAMHTAAARAAMETVGPATAASTLRATAAALEAAGDGDGTDLPAQQPASPHHIAAWLGQLADQLAIDG